MEYQILYQAAPAWTVGETEAEREERVCSGTPCGCVDCYPGNYAGRVIAIRAVADVASGALPSLQGAEDKDRPMVVLDLDAAGRDDVASRKKKIIAGQAELVTFDDRWGAVSATLCAQFADPEAAEARADDPLDAEGCLFVEVSSEAIDLLPPAVTHTGTGIYAVKVTPAHNDDTQSGAPAGQVVTLVTGGLGTADAWKGGYVTNATRSETRAIASHTDGAVTLEGSLSAWLDTDDLDIYDAWSTIQSALDQLWTDQGSATFTTLQYIRIFAGTYNENVVVNGSLTPDLGRHALIIEGDPSAARDDVHVTPSAGDGPYWSGPDYVFLRHLKVTTSGTHGVYAGAGSAAPTIDDVHVVTTGLYGMRLRSAGEVVDCAIDQTNSSSGSRGLYSNWAIGMSVLRTSIRNEAPSPAGYGIHGGNFIVESCTISGYNTGIRVYDSSIVALVKIVNCVIHDCSNGLALGVSNGSIRLDLQNTIFSGCGDCIQIYHAFPHETAGELGMRWKLRNNCFYDYTNFAHDSFSAKTYAEVAAMEHADVAGDILVDPLMANPAAYDFSLTDASPCKWAGHGSGAVADVIDVAFDPHHPDIGAWSSGDFQLSPPVISAITPNFDGDSFDMTVGQAHGRTVKVYTSSEIPSAFVLDAATRVGDGDLTVTGKTSGSVYYVYCITMIGNTVAGVSNVVKVLITSQDTGGIPDTSAEDISILPGVDLLLRDTHDLARNDRNLVLVDGSALVKQRLACGLQLFKSEWFLDADAGVPWYQEMLKKGVDITVIDAILRDKIVKTTGVNRILSYSSSIDAASRTVSVAFTVDTVYGPVEFEGALV